MLENWLRPLAKPLVSKAISLSKYQFGRHCLLHTENLPDLRICEVAILGVEQEAADAVRSALYPLSFPFSNLKVADLGNTRNDDPAFLQQVVGDLIEGGVFPIFIGEFPSHTLSLYQGYKDWQRLVNLAVVDQHIPFRLPDKEDKTYLDKVFESKQPRLLHFTVMGYQNHFVPKMHVEKLEAGYHHPIRLGQVRKDIQEMEPYMRDADILGFHLGALRFSEAPAQHQPSPAGFWLEEAAQLVRYAGISDKLTSAGFFGYKAEEDKSGQSAQVVAQLIWYLIEGIVQRKTDFPMSTDGLLEYLVAIKDLRTPLVFWKSQKSGRWWIQVELGSAESKERHRLVPCSYQDYQSAMKGELPERLISALHRFGQL